jgi:pyruvate kinase
MDVVRMNTAHQTPEQTLKIVENVRKISDMIPIMVDTKGPEVRTNASEVKLEVKYGQLIMVKGAKDVPTSKNCLYVNYESIVEKLQVGNKIMIDDGETSLTVKEKHADHLICHVDNDGVIKGKKSVNLPGVTTDLPSLTKRDIEYIEFSIKHNLDFIAHSFVRNKQDVIGIQNILDKHQSNMKIIAKIENQEGVDNLEEILPHVMGVMVARGDLAIEIPAERIPSIQAAIIKKCLLHKKIVIVATQMLHSMINNPRPTRAEVTDVATAIFSGTDAIMLSGETTIGKYPAEAVETMTRIAAETEKNRPYELETDIIPIDNQISVFLSKIAVRSIEKVGVKAIITDTDTGKTVRFLASFRGKVPIYAQCYNERVARRLNLRYGVLPTFLDKKESTKGFTRLALTRLVEKGELQSEDLVAIVAGNFGKQIGPSYVEISTVSNLLTSNWH